MPDHLSFLDRIKKEWRVIRSAPWSFAAGCLTLAMLGWLAIAVHYRGTIDQQKATLESKEERLKLRDETITYYRERYGLVAYTNNLALLRSAELRHKALAFVASLRDFQNRLRTAEVALLEAGHLSITNPVDLAAAAKTIGPLRQEYETKFRTDGLSLLDELLVRTKPEKRPLVNRASFEALIVSYQIPDICIPLEQMAVALALVD